MADEIPTKSPPAEAPETPKELTEEPAAEQEHSRSPPPEPVTVTETDTPLPPPTTTQVEEEKEVIEAEKPTQEKEDKKIPQSLVSFKEESNRLTDLSDSEKKALEEVTKLVQQLLKDDENKQVHIWGIPLLLDERSDVILLKFLRARDFKVKEAFAMLKNTLKWRKEFGIDGLVDENLGDDLDKVVFMDGYDKEGHPVCYNVYGEFQNKDLYNKTFGDEEKRTKFLRWRIQFLERSIRKLDFSPGGVNTIFQVSDLKNSPGAAKTELRIATKRALQLLQDNYPEFVAKQVYHFL